MNEKGMLKADSQSEFRKFHDRLSSCVISIDRSVDMISCKLNEIYSPSDTRCNSEKENKPEGCLIDALNNLLDRLESIESKTSNCCDQLERIV